MRRLWSAARTNRRAALAALQQIGKACDGKAGLRLRSGMTPGTVRLEDGLNFISEDFLLGPGGRENQCQNRRQIFPIQTIRSS